MALLLGAMCSSASRANAATDVARCLTDPKQGNTIKRPSHPEKPGRGESVNEAICSVTIQTSGPQVPVSASGAFSSGAASTPVPASNTKGDSQGKECDCSTFGWHDVLRATFDKLDKLVWALLILFAICYYGRGWLPSALARVTKFKGGGVEFEFSPERAREVQASFKDSYAGFVSAAKGEYDRQVGARELNLRLGDTLRQLQTKHLLRLPRNWRATIHVPDIVFDGYLYQLLDYCPSGSGSGRRFSQRFGIIGRVWREQESLGEGDALRLGGSPEDTPKALVAHWGMTWNEAQESRSARPSFLCVLLRGSALEKTGKKSAPVGILYLDSEEENAYGNTEDATGLARQLEGTAEVLSLASDVEAIMNQLRTSATTLKIDRLN